MSPRNKYDQWGILVKSVMCQFWRPIIYFSCYLYFCDIFLYWFLFTLMEKWKGPCICHLLILLSILSAPVLLLPGVPSIFQGVFWTNRFQGDDKTKFSNNYCPWEKAKTFSQPPNQNQEIFVSRGHYSWDIIYMKTTMPLDSLTYTNSIFIASITTDLCKIQVTCNMKTWYRKYASRGDIGILWIRHRRFVKGAIRWPVVFFSSEAV